MSTVTSQVIANIGAKPLPNGCVNTAKQKVVYPYSIRQNIKLNITNVDGHQDFVHDMNLFMHGIEEVERTENGYKGISSYNGEQYPFEINLEAKRIKGLFGAKSSQIKPRTWKIKRNAFRISKRFNSYFQIGLVIACFELLLSGYYCKWDEVSVNHLDNSGSNNNLDNENLLFDNFELFDSGHNSLNLIHGIIWNELDNIGIMARFSIHSDIINYCKSLIASRNFDKEHVMQYPNGYYPDGKYIVFN